MNNRDQQGFNANDNSKFNIGKVVQNFFAPPESGYDPETKLLNAVKNEVASRLAQSLHRRVYVELDKTEDPSHVTSPWSMDVKLGHNSEDKCPEGTRIITIFDKKEIGGRLLILGAPGSGKTTLLLQLAEELVQRAEANAKAPVPVLLNLSAWKTQYSDIRSWMVVDLKQKYGVRQDIAEGWIEAGHILPLLDGLDELMSQRQETCVQALNDFLPDWTGTPLVVCSRFEEYQVYESNLGLNGSVIVKPLTDKKIETYLCQAKCDWLWQAICPDRDIMNPETGLARSPLFLSMLVLASDKLPPELWRQDKSAKERRRILFEAYINARLSRPYRGGENYLVRSQKGDHRQSKRKPVHNPYPKDERTKRWLGWLAARSIEDVQTELFIEKLQPYFLKTSQQKFICRLFIRLVRGVVLGLFLGLIGGLTYRPVGGLFLGLIVGLFTGLVLGLIGGLFLEPIYWIFGINTVKRLDRIKTVESIKIAFPFEVINSCKFMRGYLVSGIFIGLAFWRSFGLFFGVIIGLLGGLVVWLIESLIFEMIGDEIGTKVRDNQGIYQSIKNSLIFGMIFMSIAIFILTVLHYLDESSSLSEISILGTGTSFLLSAFAGGLNSVIQHSGLRITLWLFGYAPWNYSKFLRYCTDRGFLQRVGGGYRFVHALLRDHFAEHYDPY